MRTLYDDVEGIRAGELEPGMVLIEGIVLDVYTEDDLVYVSTSRGVSSSAPDKVVPVLARLSDTLLERVFQMIADAPG